MTRQRYRLPEPFEELDHTADAGILVRGDTPETALARLILGFAALLSGGAPVGTRQTVVVLAEPSDRAAMAVDLLRELLYRFERERVIPSECEIRRFDPETGAEVLVGLGAYTEAHAEGMVLKAVTWHEARFEVQSGQWVAQVVFDV